MSFYQHPGTYCNIAIYYNTFKHNMQYCINLYCFTPNFHHTLLQYVKCFWYNISNFWTSTSSQYQCTNISNHDITINTWYIRRHSLYELYTYQRSQQYQLLPSYLDWTFSEVVVCQHFPQQQIYTQQHHMGSLHYSKNWFFALYEKPLTTNEFSLSFLQYFKTANPHCSPNNDSTFTTPSAITHTCKYILLTRVAE